MIGLSNHFFGLNSSMNCAEIQLERLKRYFPSGETIASGLYISLVF